jgi:pre-mRNA-splicing helicase BRR2
VTTPDKWDLISRRWRRKKVLQQVRLVIADELQLLESEAGPAMEVCVSRMRYISAQLQHPIRIVGLAASLGGF